MRVGGIVVTAHLGTGWLRAGTKQSEGTRLAGANGQDSGEKRRACLGWRRHGGEARRASKHRGARTEVACGECGATYSVGIATESCPRRNGAKGGAREHEGPLAGVTSSGYCGRAEGPLLGSRPVLSRWFKGYP